MRSSLATVFVPLALFGCDEPALVAAADAGLETSAIPSGCDVALCPEAVAPGDEHVAPVESFGIKVGTNTAGQTDIESFSEALEDGPLEVVLGNQGAWMVVLAAATDALPCCVDRVNVKAKLTGAEGKVFGELAFKRRPVFLAADGAKYILNIWLVIGDPESWEDQQAVLEVELEPYGGGIIVSDQVPVVLRRAAQATAPSEPGARRE